MIQNSFPSFEQILRGTAVAIVYAGILFAIVRLAHRRLVTNFEKIKNNGGKNENNFT
jgi:hypothetical protein